MSDQSSTPAGPFWREIRLVVWRARQVWRMVPRRDRWALGGAALLMALASAAATGVPFVIGHLIDGVKERCDHAASADVIFRYAALCLGSMAALVVLREGLHVVRRYLVESTCTRIDRHLSVKMVSHLLRVELSRLTHEKVGALHGRLFRSIDGFVRLLRLSCLDFLPAVFTGLLALTMTALNQPLVGLAMAGVVPVSIALTVWQIRSQHRVRLDLMRSREELDGTVVEQLGGIDYVRVAHTHGHEVRRVERAAENRQKQELRHHVCMSLFGSAKALSEGFFHLAVLGLGVYLAVTGRITYGTIFTFSALFLSVMTPLSEIHHVVDEGHEASLRAGDLMELLALPVDPSFSSAARKATPLEKPHPVIRTEGLCVQYATAAGHRCEVLNDLSLTIHQGETVGIVGRTGCGKSTLLKVLMRLVHPNSGAVHFKGVPLAELSRELISQFIGYVGQVPFMFSGTIEANVAYGCPRPWRPEDIQRACERACIHDDILRMPEGYRTLLAERGQNLSGGQRQRLALARVFLQAPPVLILDEATSALDAIVERHVQRAINEARADRTVIIVAHRLSTLTDTDRILVFEGGRIVETGRYEELVQRGGLFREMALSAGQGVPAMPHDGQVVQWAS
jgi:ATP-binding cassette subfamily B protein